MVETATKTESAGATTSDAEASERSAMPGSSKSQVPGLPLRLVSSTTIISVILFTALNFAIEKYDPLERLFWTGLTGARQHIFVSKLPRLMSAPKNPDVLVLGSSISLYPAVRADDELAGRKARWDFWYERNVILPYEKAEFLEKKLSDWAGKNVSVSNASVAGSLVSDQLLILKKYLAAGKTCKAVVVCLSPRDFVDNSRADIDTTPTANALRDWNSLPELLSSGASWQSITDEALGILSNYYAHRQEYSQFLTNLAASTLNRPVTLFDATNKAEAKKSADQGTRDTFFNPNNTAIYQRPPNTLGHLDEYKSMYLPVDKKQFATQTKAFNNFLDLAKKHEVPVLVVRTPLPIENTNLLPEKTLAKYQQVLKDGCARSGAVILTPDTLESYETAKDFEDASHMNTSGGIKLYSAIAETLKANQKFAKLK
ncbi:hypothetical protein KF707_07635 [Candidatus Obscuribacterales bacterium]|nr:hypothetical protein [Candidatus Obscuribacterales bacterium]